MWNSGLWSGLLYLFSYEFRNESGNERMYTQSNGADHLYQFEIHKLDGSVFDMSCLVGKLVLFVNVASNCGFTPQYQGLESIFQKYKDRGLMVVGVPCNQFGQQEPGTAEEIQNGCLMEYNVSFPVLEKVDVNGENAHPIFQWLRQECPGLFGTTIKWNFTKFLVDRQGRAIDRFSPLTSPASLERRIESLL